MPHKDKQKRSEAFKAWRAQNRHKTNANSERWRKLHPEYYAAYARSERKCKGDAIAQYKLERGCVICGYRDHPEALQFDHLPGTEKSGAVSAMKYHAAREKVDKEIEKCQIVCANCHAVLTAQRRHEAREAKKADQQLRLRLVD